MHFVTALSPKGAFASFGVIEALHMQQVALSMATHSDFHTTEACGGTFLTADATQAPQRGNIKADRVYPQWGTELPRSEWLEMSRAGLTDQGDNCHKLLPCGLACLPHKKQL